jgi:hypothetical protein
MCMEDRIAEIESRRIMESWKGNTSAAHRSVGQKKRTAGTIRVPAGRVYILAERLADRCYGQLLRDESSRGTASTSTFLPYSRSLQLSRSPGRQT